MVAVHESKQTSNMRVGCWHLCTLWYAAFVLLILTARWLISQRRSRGIHFSMYDLVLAPCNLPAPLRCIAGLVFHEHHAAGNFLQGLVKHNRQSPPHVAWLNFKTEICWAMKTRLNEVQPLRQACQLHCAYLENMIGRRVQVCSASLIGPLLMVNCDHYQRWQVQLLQSVCGCASSVFLSCHPLMDLPCQFDSTAVSAEQYCCMLPRMLPCCYTCNMCFVM